SIFASFAGGAPGVPARPSILSLVIEPELYRYFASRIVRGQRAECINALDCSHRRDVERRHTARLFDLDVRRMSVARDIERQINPLRLHDPWIDFILQPVLGDFPLHGLHVPGEPAAEIAAASGKSKSALG